MASGMHSPASFPHKLSVWHPHGVSKLLKYSCLFTFIFSCHVGCIVIALCTTIKYRVLSMFLLSSVLCWLHCCSLQIMLTYDELKIICKTESFYNSATEFSLHTQGLTTPYPYSFFERCTRQQITYSKTFTAFALR